MGISSTPSHGCVSYPSGVRQLSAGWWYTTKLPRGRCVAVFLSDRDLVPAGTAAAFADWTQKLAYTEHVKPMVECCGPATTFQLRAANSYILDPMAGENWLAVGDAATAFDPLSSMGILKALQNGMTAANAIMQWLAGDRAAMSVYVNDVTREFDRYLNERHFFYSRERRWPEAPFWQRRTGAT